MDTNKTPTATENAMMTTTQTPALDRLAARLDRDAYYSAAACGYVLPHGAALLDAGNAAALGVQLAHVVRRYPRLFAAAAREYAARK